MKNILLIGFGGSIGAILRFLIAQSISSRVSTSFPFGTFAVNIIGALIIGFLYGLSERFPIAPEYQMLLKVGFLGAFTTFSTFSLETFHLLRNGEMFYAVLNIAVSCIVGVIAVLIGFNLSGLVAQKLS